MGIKLAAILFVVGVLLVVTAPAKADHLTYLPLVPNTPLMREVATTQGYTFCFNDRANAYPGFVAQVREVTQAYTRLAGIKAREVGYDSSCQVRHEMLDSHPCSGCAAWILYANSPVSIQYKASVGYVSWQTTIGHELGHGLLGLHEQYRDSSGGIGCTGKTTTVMDCGSGVRYPTSRDVSLGCALYLTAWCGTDATQTCDRGTGDPRWDSCIGRWVFADGWSVEPVSGDWYTPAGAREWSRCNADSLRWNYTLTAWVPPFSGFYLPSRGFWTFAGAC